MDDTIGKVEKRASGRSKASKSNKRSGIYVDTDRGFKKRSGIYIDPETERRSARSAVLIEDNMAENVVDETTPLLEDVSKQIIARTSRLDSETNDLIRQGENLSNSAAGFERIPPRPSKSGWRRLCCCC